MGAVRDRLRDPVVWGNAFLLVKAAGAAVLAWVLAKSVFGLAQPFLAPWAALLTVHATVYRTFARGAQQVSRRCSACCWRSPPERCSGSTRRPSASCSWSR